MLTGICKALEGGSCVSRYLSTAKDPQSAGLLSSGVKKVSLETSLRCQILIPEDALGDVFGGEGGFDASCQQMCVVCGLCGAQCISAMPV